jgi:hypothetical protein
MSFFADGKAAKNDAQRQPHRSEPSRLDKQPTVPSRTPATGTSYATASRCCGNALDREMLIAAVLQIVRFVQPAAVATARDLPIAGCPVGRAAAAGAGPRHRAARRRSSSVATAVEPSGHDCSPPNPAVRPRLARLVHRSSTSSSDLVSAGFCFVAKAATKSRLPLPAGCGSLGCLKEMAGIGATRQYEPGESRRCARTTPARRRAALPRRYGPFRRGPRSEHAW